MVHDHLSSRLKDKVQILTLGTSEAAESYTWSPLASRWAAVEYDTSQNLFSRIGIGTRGVRVALRMQPLTLHQALCWRDKHLFLTAIRDHDNEYLELEAALVTVETCQSDGVRFPGVLTEKYLSHAQEWPMSVNELRLVLVVPKAIVLRPGHLVDVRGAEWEILVPHELDEYKNEYEIGRAVEL